MISAQIKKHMNEKWMFSSEFQVGKYGSIRGLMEESCIVTRPSFQVWTSWVIFAADVCPAHYGPQKGFDPHNTSQLVIYPPLDARFIKRIDLIIFCILAPNPCSGTWQMLSKYLPIHSCRIQQSNHLMLREVACLHSMFVTKPVLCLGLCPFYYIISIIVWFHVWGWEGHLKAVTSSPCPTGHHTQQCPWGQVLPWASRVPAGTHVMADYRCLCEYLSLEYLCLQVQRP